MKTSFTTEEIEKASKNMKNRKSVGEDGLYAEYVKYGPPEIQNGIATLLNTIARTGKYPEEIKSGILAPLTHLFQNLDRNRDRQQIFDQLFCSQ